MEGALSAPCAHSPLYDQYCKDHFRDGHCDQGCNSAECEWDGLDCAGHVPERLAAGTLVLVVLMPPEQLRNHSLHFLRELSRLLHTNVVFKRDASGQQMIFPYYGREEELHKHPIRRSVAGGASLLPGSGGGRRRRELDPMDIRGWVRSRGAPPTRAGQALPGHQGRPPSVSALPTTWRRRPRTYGSWEG